jgi:hypothetical protein
MQQGIKPLTGEENQSEFKLTISVPPSMGAEISRRIKSRRRKEPAFSRNDLMRLILLEYFRRHPLADTDQP